MNTALRAKIVLALSEYDRKQAEAARKNPRRHHSPYAIGIYLQRLDEVMADIDRGADPAAAISAGFEGPLLRTILRKAGLAEAPVRGATYLGCPVYAPVTPDPADS